MGVTELSEVTVEVTELSEVAVEVTELSEVVMGGHRAVKGGYGDQ